MIRSGNKGFWFFFFMLLLLPAGCVSLEQPREAIEYYTLEYEAPIFSKRKPLPVVVRVDRFSVGPDYDTNRMIYRDGSFKRNAYTYHKWRSSPGDLSSHFLARALKESGWFKAALSHGSRAKACCVLEGSVDEFFEWDEADQWHAVLSISVTLHGEGEPGGGRTVLFQGAYEAKEACRHKHPQALAEAMSRAMSAVSGRVIEDVYDLLKDRT